jgi:monovalent cation/proton antiporter MnhG/PhaG subunit
VTAREVAVAVLLTLGVATELVCCVGVLAMRGAYDKLHYTAPATTVGALAIALAVVVQESLSQAGIKALLIFLALLVTNPVLTHATARAARVRQLGSWQAGGPGGSRARPQPTLPATTQGRAVAPRSTEGPEAGGPEG